MMLGRKAPIRVSELFLIQTGTYQDQYLRPYIVDADANYITQLADDTHGGNVISTKTIENVAGSMVKPSTVTSGLSMIPHGWGMRRFSFLLKVVEDDPITTSSQITRLFYGYTDLADMSHNNNIAPEMKMYFSAETTVITNWRTLDNGATVPHSRVLGSTQIINPMDMARSPDNIMGMPDTTWLIRPEDTFVVGGNNIMNQILESSGMVNGKISSVIDQRSLSTKGVPYQLNRRLDNSPSRYLTNSFSSYMGAVKEQRSEHEDEDPRYASNPGLDRDRLYMDAAARGSVGKIHQISFFDHITRNCGYLERGYIEYGQLVREFENVDQNTQVSLDTGQSIRKLSHAQDSAPWNRNDLLGVAVSTIAQTIPAIMMECCLASVRFTVTPGHGYGNYNIIVFDEGTATMFGNLADRDVLGFIEEFKRRLTVDVLNPITHNNQVFLSLGMSTHLMSESVIDIHFADNNQMRFVAPTFSDNLFPPVATLQEGHRNKVANDLLWIMNEAFDPAINDNATGHASQQPFPQGAQYGGQPNATYSPGLGGQQQAPNQPSNSIDPGFTGLL